MAAVLCAPPSAGAQQRVLDTYSLEEGLPQSQVFDVLQDERGYLWFALLGGGVGRFDGHTFTTLTAEDGLPSDAVEALRTQSYDVVLMDVQMPKMDGIEATRCIREEWAPDEQPYIIALTAAVTEEDRRRCHEAGADDFLSKPLESEALADALPSRSGPAA